MSGSDTRSYFETFILNAKKTVSELKVALEKIRDYFAPVQLTELPRVR